MAQWTNDEWVSTLHRVVTPPLDQAKDSRRVSLTFFHQPNHDALIECIPTCRREAPKYAPITSGAHLESKRVAMQVVRTGDPVRRLIRAGCEGLHDFSLEIGPKRPAFVRRAMNRLRR